MAKSKSKEKRRNPRFPLGIMLDVHIKGQTTAKCRGAIADLSVGGMTFKTSAQLDPGMSLYLKVNIPLEIRGEIRHTRRSASGGLHRYGVRFHHIGFTTPEDNKPDSFISAKFATKKRNIPS